MAALLAEETIRESLREVIDPEIGINIVDLGLIYEIELAPAAEADGHDVSVTMTLTTPGCPAGPQILQQVKQVVEAVPGGARHGSRSHVQPAVERRDAERGRPLDSGPVAPRWSRRGVARSGGGRGSGSRR